MLFGSGCHEPFTTQEVSFAKSGPICMRGGGGGGETCGAFWVVGGGVAGAIVVVGTIVVVGAGGGMGATDIGVVVGFGMEVVGDVGVVTDVVGASTDVLVHTAAIAALVIDLTAPHPVERGEPEQMFIFAHWNCLTADSVRKPK